MMMEQKSTSLQYQSASWINAWKLLPLFSVLMYGSHSVLLNLCKDESGSIPFNPAAVVLLSELAKLLFSLSFWLPEMLASGPGAMSVNLLPWSSSWVFAIPALLYSINNNLVVYIQHYMDPASFQVLSNLKIATTAILYRLVLRKRLSPRQWLAIGLLLAGTMCNSFGGIRSGEDSLARGDMYITLPGILLLLIYCSISGMSGIYTEYILKKQKQVSLHQQNALMYIYGMSFNLLGYLITSRQTSSASEVGFFHGFSMWTIIIIITQAANGLMMAFIFKHGNNIIRLFIISGSMLVTSLLSVLLFSLHLNSYFYTAFIAVVIASLLYYKDRPALTGSIIKTTTSSL